MARNVLLVMGTRPEAIKLAPVVKVFAAGTQFRPVIVASGQHPEMVIQALAAFDLKPDLELSVQRGSGSQSELASQVLTGMEQVIHDQQPVAVFVQGDTTTALAGALAAFWQQVPVVHVEAGLRSGDIDSPFPEEANRKLIGQVAALHCAPTDLAAQHLRHERTLGTVMTVGNTVIDAVCDVVARQLPYSDDRLSAVEKEGRRVILVTAHRRESWGEPLNRVLRAVAELVRLFPDVQIVLPTHPNPTVREQVIKQLGSIKRVLITDPLPYKDLARLLSISTLVLSDSGGIQEEAPSFQVPVLVLREVTERQEAVQTGCARLVGTNQELIVQEASILLCDEAERQSMTACGNPFGDGLASARIEQATAWLLGHSTIRPDSFVA